jgi:hypothetical protein
MIIKRKLLMGGRTYTENDAMRGNGEGEPLLVEMTLARNYPAELKYSN